MVVCPCAYIARELSKARFVRRGLHRMTITLRRVARRVSVLLGALVVGALGASCFTQGQTTCGQEDSPSSVLRGKLVTTEVGATVIPPDVESALAARCRSCHSNPPRNSAPFALEMYGQFIAPSKGDPSKKIFQLVGERVVATDGRKMPPAGSPDLTPDERAAITDWVAKGAPSVKSTTPMKGSVVFVELCGLYTENPDPSKGHPNYRYGTIAGDDGSFEVAVPRGAAGLHTFLPNYRYGFVALADTNANDIVVNVEPLLPQDLKPFVGPLEVTPKEAAPGQPLRFSVNVRSSTPKDPMSEEIVLLEEATKAARALDPPRRGVQGKGFPDGLWSTTVNAPTAPGRYGYTLGMTSEKCIVGDTKRVEVVVR